MYLHIEFTHGVQAKDGRRSAMVRRPELDSLSARRLCLWRSGSGRRSEGRRWINSLRVHHLTIGGVQGPTLHGNDLPRHEETRGLIRCRWRQADDYAVFEERPIEIASRAIERRLNLASQRS